jgi:hypothetical protein
MVAEVSVATTALGLVGAPGTVAGVAVGWLEATLWPVALVVKTWNR